MTALQQMRNVVRIIGARHMIDVELFGESGGETLETKKALEHAQAVLDWLEGLVSTPETAGHYRTVTIDIGGVHKP